MRRTGVTWIAHLAGVAESQVNLVVEGGRMVGPALK
jgi:hypothetical protein